MTDADTPKHSEQLIVLGLIWRWKAAKGLDYAEDFAKYERRVVDAMGRDAGKARLFMDGTTYDIQPVILVPRGSFGGKPQKQITRTQVSRTLSVPSPVGGWNARDPLAEMASNEAVQLDNFFCTPFDVTVRYGYSNQSTGITGSVNTLISYSPPSGALKLFAFAGANVYDASNVGVIGAPVLSGITLDRQQHVNYGTAGGNFIVSCSGSESPYVYNGTAWGPIQGAAFNTAVTSVTSTGTTATVMMAAAHGLLTGMSMTLSGFTPAGYNGTYVITVTGLTTFTYTLPSAQAATTVTGTATPPAGFVITGVNPNLFNNVTIFKSRMWFVEKNSLRVWYLPTLSIGGAASPLDFSSLFNQGGYLMAMGDWSLDAGYGMDDYAVFMASQGQVAIYRGTDPTTAATWSLVGVYDMGSPIGKRCMIKYAGDILVICQDGLIPLSKALMSSRINTVEALSDKIQHVISDYVSQYATSFGWETVLFPKENMLLVNVPYSATQSYQLVMNTISGAWSRYIGYNAHTFTLHGDNLYFGGGGVVCKAWDTQADNGTNINFEAIQSFNYFGTSAQLKQVQMVRPIISTDGVPALLLGVNVDFDTSAPVGIPTFKSSNRSVWDTAVWDGTTTWGGDLQIKRDWQTAYGLGYCIAAHMKGYSMVAKMRWISTDYLVASGGVI